MVFILLLFADVSSDVSYCSALFTSSWNRGVICYVVVADVDEIQSGTRSQLHWYSTAEFSHPELQLQSLRMFLALAQSPRSRGYTSCVLQKQEGGVTQQVDQFLSYSSKAFLKFSCSFCPLGRQYWVPICPLCCSSAPKIFSQTLLRYETWSLGKVLSCFHPLPPDSSAGELSEFRDFSPSNRMLLKLHFVLATGSCCLADCFQMSEKN